MELADQPTLPLLGQGQKVCAEELQPTTQFGLEKAPGAERVAHRPTGADKIVHYQTEMWHVLLVLQHNHDGCGGGRIVGKLALFDKDASRGQIVEISDAVRLSDPQDKRRSSRPSFSPKQDVET